MEDDSATIVAEFDSSLHGRLLYTDYTEESSLDEPAHLHPMVQILDKLGQSETHG